MAAHMPKVLNISCAKFAKSRIFSKECALLRPFLRAHLHARSGNSSSANSTPSDSVFSQDDLSNQGNVEGSYADVPTARKQLPSLIKPFDDENANLSFATLFRNSNFVHLGNPKGKVVEGRIYRVVGDDLYIDFDWKFPCVVKRPTQDAHLYVNNATVRLRIIDLEMSTIFLGAAKETSLNEANCFLLGLINSPLGVPNREGSSNA